MKLSRLALFAFIAATSYAVADSHYNGSETVTDKDGNVYRTVDIGGQIWMATNLNVATGNSYCEKPNPYPKNTGNCGIFGRVYKWDELMNLRFRNQKIDTNSHRGICPEGYRIPTEEDYLAVLNYDDSFVQKFWLNHEDEYWSTSSSDDRRIIRVLFATKTEASTDWARADGYARVRCIKAGTKIAEQPKVNVETVSESADDLKDKDGRTYKTVKIGNQVWMAEDLKTNVKKSQCSGGTKEGCRTYGRLYSWSEAMGVPSKVHSVKPGHQGICPNGWHIPTVEEFWTMLTKTNYNISLADEQNSLYGFNGNSGAYKIEYGELRFNNPEPRPTSRYSSGGSRYWVSSGECDDRSIKKNEETTVACWHMSYYDAEIGLPVRCLRNQLANENAVTIKDRDGNTYKTVKIGKQVWMAENLRVETTSSRCVNDNPKLCEKYGRLYRWSEAMDVERQFKRAPSKADEDLADWIKEKHQGICPDGWYIPTQRDFEVLKKATNDEIFWNSPYGFAPQPTASGTSPNGTLEIRHNKIVYDYGVYANFWTSSSHRTGLSIITKDGAWTEWLTGGRAEGVRSIRCIKGN